MDDQISNKIVTDNGTLIRVYVKLSQNSLEFTIFHTEDAWKSTVLKEELINFSKQYKMNLESYCERLSEYIQTVNSDVIYIFNDGEFTINRIIDNSLKVKFFTCKLNKVSYVKEAEEVMDVLAAENSEISKKLDYLTKEKNEINEQKIHYETKLKELIDKKLSDENEQFGQFVLVLNEKKRRIQHLEELLEAFKNGRSSVNPIIEIKTKQRKTKAQNVCPVQKKEVISASEPSDSDSNYNSSGEESGSNNNFQEEKPSVAESKSTSPLTLDFLEDDTPHSRSSLPKRQKTKHNVEVTVIKPTSSKSSPKDEMKETKNSGRSKTPEIDLNTQQLLDML